jgi:hypothetical protein
MNHALYAHMNNKRKKKKKKKKKINQQEVETTNLKRIGLFI